MMATKTEIQSYRERELRRAEETLRVAQEYLEKVEGRYRRGERIGPENTSPLAATETDMSYAQGRVRDAERVVSAWRLLLEQPAGGAHLVAVTPIRFDDREIRPGERFVVPDDQVGSIAQLLEVGSATVADPLPWPSRAAKLGSSELRKRLAIIDERRQRRREAFAEAEAELTAAQSTLRELHVANELDGQKPAAGAIAKAEARVAEAERAVRAKRAALEVETERTEADRQTYETGLTEAVALEAQTERDAVLAKAEEAMSDARRRTVRAYVEIGNAIAAEWRIARELERVVAETAAETGIRMSRDVLIVDVDGSRSLPQIIDFLGKLRETKACGLIPRVRYGASAAEHVYETEELAR